MKIDFIMRISYDIIEIDHKIWDKINDFFMGKKQQRNVVFLGIEKNAK